MMVKNLYPRLKNLIGFCTLGLVTCGSLLSETAMAQPTISSVSSMMAIPLAGLDTITGTGFNTTTSKNVVYYGATKAAITSGTATQLVVTVPLGALHARITVTDTASSVRKTGYTQYPFVPEYDNSCFIAGGFNFKPRIDISVGATALSYIAQVGDLDGDGKTDLAVGNYGSNNFSVYRNTSTGAGDISQTFVNSFAAIGRVVNVKMADFDNDGKLDVVTALENSVALNVFRNTTTAAISFGSRQTDSVSFAGSTPHGVDVADFDGDGKTDIAVVLQGSDSVSVLRNVIATGTPVSTTAGFAAGTASFARYITFSTGGGSTPTSLFVADIDGDGKPDIITCNSGNGKISVLRNTSSAGTISFASHADFSFTSGSTCTDVSAADIDGDGKMDVFVSTNDATSIGSLTVFRNTSSVGSVSFASFVDFSTGTSSSNLASGVTSADIDGDGKVDVLLNALFSSSTIVYRNTSSSGTISLNLSTTLSSPSGYGPVAVTVADLDNDKKPDVIAACRSLSASPVGSVSIFRNYPIPRVDTITGPLTICTGSTTDTLKNTVSGGYWASTGHATNINTTTGVLTPIAVGMDTITYTVVCQGDTNSITRTINVATTPTVSPLSGLPTTFCSGDTTHFSSLTPGGTWSSSNITIASVTPGGRVIGVAGGTATISYSLSNACGAAFQTRAVTINQTPGPITGVTHQCVGASDTLRNAYTGGTWSRSFTFVNVGATSGRITGVTAGVDTVRYTLTGGCSVYTLDTVLPAAPTVSAITGTSTICVGTTTTFSSTTAGGRWSSGNTAIATVDSLSGVVTGVAAGGTTITYTVSSACGSNFQVRGISVGAMPGAITSSGSFTVCAGTSVTLSDSAAGGSWTSSAGGTAAIGAVSSSGGRSYAVVTGGSTSGTATITYTLSSVCSATTTITVNPAPSGISGSSSVCIGGSTTLSNTTGGSWASSNSGIAAIGTTTSTTAVVNSVDTGNVIISFTSSSYGCTITRAFRVNPLPNAITGPGTVCAGSTITLTETGGTGTWSTSFAGIASVVGSGLTATVYGSTGVTATSTADITFTSTGTGCARTVTITVEPVPAAITGSHTVCMGSTDTLSTTTTGGTWSVVSGPVSISSTGVVTPTGVGAAVVKYAASGTGCFVTYAVTVNPVPAAITGTPSVCPGYTDTLRSTTAGGTWTSVNTSLATILPAGTGVGVARGVAAGVDTIFYTLSTGCYALRVITVRPAPAAIAGPSVLCFHTYDTLRDATGGGIWTSSNPSFAQIDSFSGRVYGTSAGTATISYTTPTYGCSAFLTFTVLPTLVPSVAIAMTTPTTICAGTYVTYTANLTNGGSAPTYLWRINGAVTGTGPTLTYAPVNGDSVNVFITSNAQCAVPTTARSYVKMTVNPLLTPSVNITTGLGDTVCLGSAITFNPNPVNGGSSPSFTWKVNGVPVWTGPTWTYYPTDSDVIQVKMQTSVTCKTSDTAVDALILTVSPYITPTVAITGSDTICEGYPVIYHVVSSGGGTAPTYNWYKNGSTTPFASGPALAYIPVDGDYVYVKMTSNFPCVTSTTATSAVDTITVIPVYMPSVTVTVTPGWILAAGSTAYFATTVVNGGASPTYQWFKNGGIIYGATNPTYRTSTLTSYDSFVCRVTNHDFCNGITSFGYSIIVIGDNVGVNEVAAANAMVNLVPNPNNGTFTLTGDLATGYDEDVDMEITNMLGQVVYRDRIRAANGNIDQRIQLDGTPANGMYMINVHSEHVSKVIRFVIEK